MSLHRHRSPYFWEEAPFLRPALALIAGILLYETLPVLHSPRALIAGAVLSIIAMGVCSLRRNPRAMAAALQPVMIPVSFVLLGLLACAARDPELLPDFPRTPPEGPTVAVIRSAPRLFESGQSFAVAILNSAGPDRSIGISAGGRVVCYNDSSGAPAFLEGDTVLLRGTWERFQPAGNPYEHDLGTAMRRKGLHFRLQTGASGIRLLGRPDPASYGVLRRIHNHCAGQLNRFIPDRKALGLIQAMLLGDEAGFDPVLRGLYADTGIIHIISISGSHVAMLFAVIAALLQWIPGERGAWIRYGTGLLLVWLYVLVAGAPPSALRSAVMFSVVALSTLSKREGRGLNTLCSAGFILLIAEPAWLFAPGFQLSFAAVLSLMLFYQPLQRLLPVRHRPLRWIWQAVCASIAAEVLTAPIVLLYFHSFPLMFIPANILAGVMIGAGGLIGGMLVIVLSPIPPLAHALGTLLGWMLDITNHGLSGLQRLSPEAFRHLYLSTGGFILLMAGIILMAVAWLRKNRGAFLIGMFAAAALLTLNLADAIHRQRQHRLVIYNNGRQALIDEIRNSGHLGLATAQSDYHASPARDAWGAWSRSNDTKGSPYFHFGKQRLLILSDSGLRKPTSRLPVDVLILTQAARRIRIDSALHCFQPGCVVLASRVSERRCRLWADSCRQRGIRFHAVQTMGAWQLQ